MKSILHYYGDEVRVYFIIGAVIMLVTLPVLRDLILVPPTVSLIAILIIAVAAGLTNPKHVWAAIINVAISGVALIMFENYAVNAYSQYGFKHLLFITDQILALNFLAALYFSVKTLRGMLLHETP